MKKSELVKIIKEEKQKLLKEGYADSLGELYYRLENTMDALKDIDLEEEIDFDEEPRFTGKKMPKLSRAKAKSEFKVVSKLVDDATNKLYIFCNNYGITV